MGKYQRETEKLQSTGMASSTLFLVEVPLDNEEQASVDDITQEEASRLQPQLRHLPARHPKQVRVGYRIPLQVRVALSPALSKSIPLRAFSIPSRGRCEACVGLS